MNKIELGFWGFFLLVVVSGCLAFDKYFCSGPAIEFDCSNTSTSNQPEISIDFTRVEGWHDATPIKMGDVEFVREGQRSYQWFKTNKMGYIVRYKIKSTDPKKSLAYYDPVEREEPCGKIKYPITPHSLSLMPIPKISNGTSWKIYRIDGLMTEHWKPDGSIQCVSSCGFKDHVNINYFIDRNVMELENKPLDGWWDDKRDHPNDDIPLHVVEVDFYFHPTE